MPRPTIQIDTSGINRILRNLPGNRDRLVRRIAFEVEARAKQKAPVDTGALQASIHTRGRLMHLRDSDGCGRGAAGAGGWRAHVG